MGPARPTYLDHIGCRKPLEVPDLCLTLCHNRHAVLVPAELRPLARRVVEVHDGVVEARGPPELHQGIYVLHAAPTRREDDQRPRLVRVVEGEEHVLERVEEQAPLLRLRRRRVSSSDNPWPYGMRGDSSPNLVPEPSKAEAHPRPA